MRSSWLGLGNYDVNVLLAALHTKDCTAVWWDARLSLVERLKTENIVGFVLNVPTRTHVGPLPVPFMQNRRYGTSSAPLDIEQY